MMYSTICCSLMIDDDDDSDEWIVDDVDRYVDDVFDWMMNESMMMLFVMIDDNDSVNDRLLMIIESI